MKATIEVSQGAVLYIILMLVVVVIGVTIVTEGQFTILFQQKKLASLFEPGALTPLICVDNVKEHCQAFSAAAVKIHCTIAGKDCSNCDGYQILVSNVRFFYADASTKKGESFKFIVALDMGDRLIYGYDSGSGSIEFSCTKNDNGEYDCGSQKTLYFEVAGVPLTEKKFLHFTMWRRTTAVESFINNGTAFSKMLDSQFQNYFGAFDVGGDVNLVGRCQEYACNTCMDQTCTQDICHNIKDCWYKSGFLGLSHSCELCKPMGLCEYYSNENECNRCKQIDGTGCKWVNKKCISA
ncbi:MAG: hypothetical protein NT120_02370 [Candidatus Aenigmarchaeota archaeon]|nr:hypothetical protein [Candidatus Aenigmarchaeota archaeon]